MKNKGFTGYSSVLRTVPLKPFEIALAQGVTGFADCRFDVLVDVSSSPSKKRAKLSAHWSISNSDILRIPEADIKKGSVPREIFGDDDEVDLFVGEACYAITNAYQTEGSYLREAGLT